MKFNTTQRGFAKIDTCALLIATFEGETASGLFNPKRSSKELWAIC